MLTHFLCSSSLKKKKVIILINHVHTYFKINVQKKKKCIVENITKYLRSVYYWILILCYVIQFESLDQKPVLACFFLPNFFLCCFLYFPHFFLSCCVFSSFLFIMLCLFSFFRIMLLLYLIFLISFYYAVFFFFISS